MLAIARRKYELLHNNEAVTFFEPFLEDGGAKFHTAGALGNGERVWTLAKLNEWVRERSGLRTPVARKKPNSR